MPISDIEFYFDPVCPFAWLTSRWIHQVADQREYEVDWRFISLRLINSHIDYDIHFPEGYEDGHMSGLRLLRVAARIRDELGNDSVGEFYTAISSSIFDSAPTGDTNRKFFGSAEHVEPILESIGLPKALAESLDDDSWDELIQSETDHALSLTGEDVGTPIIAFRPPSGPAFFGPVISRLPSDERALELWDHVVGLATFPGFAELKRSLRERPDLRALGAFNDSEVETSRPEEDWHAGSRRSATS